jgi:hypothetical protein
MKQLATSIVLLMILSQNGCAFLGGAAIGGLATGAGYELSNRSQMQRLEEDYRNERISRREYWSRKAQIEQGSVLY